MIAFLAAALLATTAPPCAPPPGTDSLFESGRRFIVVGEQHGTVESPAAFAEMVCAAAARGPVTVALEMPGDEQAAFDAFLAAPDDAAAEEALAGTLFMNPRYSDGRGSRAMLEMMLSIRRLKAQGRDVAFHLFQPFHGGARERTQALYELEMGYLLSRAVIVRPDATVLALVGDWHARKTAMAIFAEDGVPAAGHLPSAETLTLHFAQQGGESWGCSQTTCGIQTTRPVYDAAARGVILQPSADGAYDGVLALGVTTASPPVAQAAP